MPIKLSTTVRKIEDIPNTTNRSLLTDFHNYLTSNGVSESHQNNNLKALTAFAHYLGFTTSFLDIKENDLIRSFLDSKLKSREDDPDKKSIVTWNDYLGRIKYFMRWLYNCRTRDSKENDLLSDPVETFEKHFDQFQKMVDSFQLADISQISSLLDNIKNTMTKSLFHYSLFFKWSQSQTKGI
jgi:hypothetical protein